MEVLVVNISGYILSNKKNIAIKKKNPEFCSGLEVFHLCLKSIKLKAAQEDVFGVA